MLVRLKQEDLEKANLSWLCIEPMLLSVRGKNLDAKSEMYAQLNEGQKALYLFYAFHNHVHTIAEFYWFTTYFISEIKAWAGLKSGISFYQDYELLNLLERLEKIIEDNNKVAEGVWKAASPSDLDTNSDLHESIKPIFNDYRLLAQQCIEKMNLYVRQHADDYMD